jgi:superfamily I DNA and/or RNA helicase
MELNQDLYNSLYSLRQRIKEIERYKYGKAPTVCTDEALYNIASLIPRKKSDFKCVVGIGETFINKYSDQFLSIINEKVIKIETPSSPITDSTKTTLRELEKKLININRRNRLLYLSKIYKKYAFDLFIENSDFYPEDIIFTNKKIKICDIRQTSDIKGQSGEEIYKRISNLLREVEKDYRDKGNFDLYIGYPFVNGRLSGENFDIRAPLVLFPIEYIKESNYISLQLDTTKDIVFNSNLLLAHYKFNNINKSLPDSTVDEFTRDTFMGIVTDFYKNQGIEIIYNSEPIKKFRDYKSGEFKIFKNGEFNLENVMVIGKFPTYANSIQKDFNKIIDEGHLNKLLDSLLASFGAEDDFYTDIYSGETEIDEKTKPLTISEHDLCYLGDLNGSQENVLSAIKKQEALVIQGPPGTGKSQTIASLIADTISMEKNVLMVAEKKTALDVVYSRLGELHKYAILIHDLNDKKDFYSQMDNLLSVFSSKENKSQEISLAANEIDKNIRTLEKIADKIYETSDFGIEFYKLYLMCKRIDLSVPREREKYTLLKEITNPSLEHFKYKQLRDMFNKFKNEKLFNHVLIHDRILNDCNWFKLVKDDLDEYSLYNFKEKANKIEQQLKEWRGSNFLSRLFNKKKLVYQIKEMCNEYFYEYKKEHIKEFINHGLNAKVLEGYDDFMNSKPIYNSLSNDELSYFQSISRIMIKLGTSLDNANDELFNFIICQSIFDFESSNRDILFSIDSHRDIIKKLSTLIMNKKEKTKEHLENYLYTTIIENIFWSKRFGDIQRKVESKRRWSINKYINYFSFELFKGIKIWMMTPDVASEILPLEAGLFDLVIFDEASQMYIEKGIPAIQRAKKVVIAGDSKQLRPTNLGSGRIEYDENLLEEEEISAALEEESLLDVARFKYTSPVTLNYHYRSKYEELIAFSNYAFYKGGLYISPNVCSTENLPIEVIKIDDGLWADNKNIAEAKRVIDLLKFVFKTRKNNETIGIITFNSKQRDLIEDLIDEECSRNQGFNTVIKSELKRTKDGEDIGLFVNNIERVQGDERDIIIFSIGYAKNVTGRLSVNFGWLNKKGGENRLNVAISRAKDKIYIITSFVPSELHIDATKNNGPKLLKKYLEYCFAISNNDRKQAKQILLSLNDASKRKEINRFDSDFEIEVYESLINNGYNVESQVGIGGYSIDLAIKKEDKYILGIECDGKLYHSSKSARERDYHRQKYLESRGWKIHRIWSSKWWKNPEKEIKKIELLVDSL